MKADGQADCTTIADAKLALLAGQGDTQAFDCLLIRYMPLVKRHAARYSNVSGIDPEDFLQEGMLALFKAAKSYDDRFQVQFSTYAFRCIGNSMITAVKKHMKSAHQNTNVYIDISDEQWLSRETASRRIPELPEEQFIDMETAQLQQQLMRSLLSDFEWQVLRLYLDGGSYQQIALVLQTTTKAVDNALQRVRRKLKTYTR
ncbi:sigma-70 family RNA polymerase sigma factor [Oscillospiraceae bacterium MB08-C2-2]|nr:sigma-70 family RNA polymerase sigma factor [Oscillospiraceae bacterium MB08-C2-2]